MSLELKDSDFQDGVSMTKDYAGYINAVGELQKQYNEGTLEILCLQSYNSHVHVECPIQYQVKCDLEGRLQCVFYSSHYIGRYSHNGYSIIINPRYGSIFSYLIGYATNLYLPFGSSDLSYNTKNNSYWLIALIWKAMLNKALTIGQIPKKYETIRKNQKHFRGHLLINKHIHANLCDATKFYCSYKKLSMDNIINRTIRAVYALLKTKGVSNVIREYEAYDKHLESMGVKASVDDIHEIESIRYNRLSESYKPVMELSKIILSNYKAEAANCRGTKTDISYFIDIAELWEIYLLKLLQNNLSSEYRVYSPNSNLGANLIDGGMRRIRPDILIEKNNSVIMIIDAKYKYYSCFGGTSESGIHRDDLYQMSTYLYHYGKQDKAIIGIFTAPVDCCGNDIHTFSENRNHKIGLVNLKIACANDDMERIHYYENEYINAIKRLLSKL